ncbi:MAG: UPF0721 transmembrane protein [Bacteroidia bacterium]|nr:MAG: UPF0721 transmembrane protein [Bacteroidia bacterium]
MITIGYILGILIGVVLGLFGAGGAIIAFPVLVYFMGINPETAGMYSLIIVGIASLTGVIKQVRNSLIDFNKALKFILPVLINFYVVKYLILPSIPDIIYSIQSVVIRKNHLIMLLFVVVLSVIIVNMLKGLNNNESTENSTTNNTNFFQYLLKTSFVGILAATIGAGGGFIIVPALIKIYNMPIKNATATSLLIIFINALFGTIINFSSFESQHITTILLFSLLSILGIFIGTYLNNITNAIVLKKSYAYFLIIVLISTLTTEIYKLTQHQ